MNILWITADELRADAVGFMGNRDVRTPHLDALATRGTVLENHFTPFPKCVPARCAMHTGRYCHSDALRTVATDNHLPKGRPNLASHLRANGYETAVFGLNHLWEDDWFYGAGESKNQPRAGAVDYTSFSGPELTAMALQARNYPDAPIRPGDWHQAFSNLPLPGPRTGTHNVFCDENRSDQAIHYLENLRDRQKPFFLQLNLSTPHPEYTVHEPFYSLYDPATLKTLPGELPSGAPLALRAQRRFRTGDDLPEAAMREILAVYYGMVSFVDEQIGRVLQTVRALGLEENTLILFTSDHGDYAGQHGLVEKWDADLRDCLLKVPCILAGPNIPVGVSVTGLSEHVDLPDTMLELAGLPNDPTWFRHGSSMAGLLCGGAGKEAVFADGGHEAALRARFNTPAWEGDGSPRIKATLGKQLTYEEEPDAMAKCKMVRTADWKLVVRETGDDELYHIVDDPYEMKNLIADPAQASRIRELQRRLLDWVLQTDPDQPQPRKVGA